jgi:hypothetical protein
MNSRRIYCSGYPHEIGRTDSKGVLGPSPNGVPRGGEAGGGVEAKSGDVSFYEHVGVGACGYQVIQHRGAEISGFSEKEFARFARCLDMRLREAP